MSPQLSSPSAHPPNESNASLRRAVTLAASIMVGESRSKYFSVDARGRVLWLVDRWLDRRGKKERDGRRQKRTKRTKERSDHDRRWPDEEEKLSSTSQEPSRLSRLLSRAGGTLRRAHVSLRSIILLCGPLKEGVSVGSSHLLPSFLPSSSLLAHVLLLPLSLFLRT